MPAKPGVYYFLSPQGKVLYVGQSGNLRGRLRSYRAKDQPPKTLLLLSQAVKLRFIIEETELDALLAEAELIRSHKPKFNARLRDDKSPLYIVVTQEVFPRVLLSRKTALDVQVLRSSFGPYPSASQTKMVLKLVRRAFPFCNAPPFQKKKRQPCFYVHIGLCPGACIGAISEKDYRKNVKNLEQFLLGKRRRLIGRLSREMQTFARKLEFEKAASARDQLQALQQILLYSPGKPGDDIEDDRQQEARAGLWKTLVPFLEVGRTFPPAQPFRRIEAYDISNLQGEMATGSMVVFIDGTPDPNEYRRFRIRGSQTPDDPEMLAQTLIRRLRHREWTYPDLIVVDGGKAQVRSAKQALATFGLQHRIPVVGIAKRLEELIVHKHIYHTLQLPKRTPALQLIMHLRDEAHRYALAYHHLLREKSLTF